MKLAISLLTLFSLLFLYTHLIHTCYCRSVLLLSCTLLQFSYSPGRSFSFFLFCFPYLSDLSDSFFQGIYF